MDWVEETKEYTKYIKQNAYVYELQKQAVALFIQFLELNPKLRQDETRGMNYFLNYWVPKCKPYLSAYDAYQLAYTMEDMCEYRIKKSEKPIKQHSDFLATSKEEYLRLYKARRALGKLVGEPVIHSDPIVIDLNAYKEYLINQKKKDKMSIREQGIFQIADIHQEGLLTLKKIGQNQYYKVLLTPLLIEDMRKGDILHSTLSKKIFFIYWEIIQIKGYYLETVKKDIRANTFV